MPNLGSFKDFPTFSNQEDQGGDSTRRHQDEDNKLGPTILNWTEKDDD
jgi:hypothetical protein